MSEQIRSLKPRKALNKAFLKVKPNRTDIERFKTNLIQLLDRINDHESEEFHKNLVIDFLKKTWYDPDHFVNTKGRNDLVIHNGEKAASTVGVIVEAKKPTNQGEMIHVPASGDAHDQMLAKINVKAFQELVLYYLRERITLKNIEIKYLIATNINQWFIFDATLFDRLFAQNKYLVRQFNDFENGRLADTKTDFFYKQIAEPFITGITQDIEFTYFDIRDYEKPLRNQDKKDDNKLIALFKLLSPEHLLKLPFANDSNSLDKRFYGELLHIIGLIETKDGSKKIIDRNKEGERNTGSLIENAIIQLDSLDKISRLDKPGQYGATLQERFFNVALELSITWINRILFLKLLEAQLVSYHKGDQSYEFLSYDKIKDYDDLNSLFFQVLARRQSERNEDIKTLFAKIPYLNSSLFEPTEMEHTLLFISNLRNDKTLPVYASTVLKNDKGKKRTGQLNPLEYLFEFLNAYDFTSEGSEEIQEDNKTLINASVLGLIFEKINGYKDGSFFTPGFITMYMARETIRKAVVQKFNEAKGWNCTDIHTLYDKIDDRNEANKIINDLKIVDPAVGSGHFLVSALNEIVAIKNDLRILQDRDGKRLKEYHFEVENDELIVTDEEGALFDYNPKSKESQRVQEALFHEKQNIIENCLFGVDINPNSVKICRLRLWIELLKNAYYKNETELETLPNIDINIKCGNSLISRFALDADLKQALKKSASKWTIDSYRLAVDVYRNAQSKDEKHSMERLINEIKTNFRSEISQNDPKIKRLRTLSGELFQMLNQGQLFEMSQKEKADWNTKLAKITAENSKLEAEIEEIKNNKIFENAFEWRFEFPEVLDNNGDFVGFDVVIGNPPYIRQEEFTTLKPYLSNNFITYNGTADLFVYFIELALNKLKHNGEFIFIIPNKWMKAGYGKGIRNFIKNKRINTIIDFGDLPVFEEASTYPCILSITNSLSREYFNAIIVQNLNFPSGIDNYIIQNSINVSINNLHENGWTLKDNTEQIVFNKIMNVGIPLSEYVKGGLYRGILTGFNQAFIIDEKIKNELITKDSKNAELIKPILAGRDIKKYASPTASNYLIFIRRGTNIDLFPVIKDYLLQFKDKLEPKPKDFGGKNWQGRKPGNYKWYEIQDTVDYYEQFEELKIVWPETSLDNQFCYVSEGVYLNKTAFFIPSTNHFLLGLLNSSFARFYFDSIVSKMRGGYFSMSKAYVETIRILEKQPYKDEIIRLVGEVNSLKKSDKTFNIVEYEKKIDQLVYQLYELTPGEIAIIEESVK